jgi:hypothetical protein
VKEVIVIINGGKRSLPVRTSPSFTSGVAGLPSGLPSMQGIFLPARGKIEVDK